MVRMVHHQESLALLTKCAKLDGMLTMRTTEMIKRAIYPFTLDKIELSIYLVGQNNLPPFDIWIEFFETIKTIELMKRRIPVSCRDLLTILEDKISRLPKEPGQCWNMYADEFANWNEVRICAKKLHMELR